MLQELTSFGRLVATEHGIENIPFSICDSTSEFKDIGIGYSLYFDVMKFLIYISIGIFIIFALPSMFFNYDGEECLSESKMEVLKEKILKTPYKDRKLLQGKSYFLPDTFGDWGSSAFEISGEMETVMMSFCSTKNLIGSEASCTKFSDLDCSSNFTEKCSEIAYKAIRKNLSKSICAESFTSSLSLGNRVGYYQKPSQSVLYFEGVTLLLVYVGLIVMFTYMIYYMFGKITQYDNAVLTPEDFTVKITGLPSKGTIDEEQGKKLRQLLHDTIEGFGFKVAEINFTYDLADYVNLRQQYCDSLGKKNYKKYIQKLQLEGKNVKIDKEMEKEQDDPIRIMLDEIVEQVLVSQEKLFEECNPNFLLGSAYVSFHTWQDAQKFEEYFGFSGKIYDFTGYCPQQENKLVLDFGKKQFNLHVDIAPQPSDIIWENLPYSGMNRWIRTQIVFILTVFCVIFSFVLFGFLELQLVTIIILTLRINLKKMKVRVKVRVKAKKKKNLEVF